MQMPYVMKPYPNECQQVNREESLKSLPNAMGGNHYQASTSCSETVQTTASLKLAACRLNKDFLLNAGTESTQSIHH